MKLWSRETREYFKTLREAKLGADYENTHAKRWNGFGYDETRNMFYVSYIYKY